MNGEVLAFGGSLGTEINVGDGEQLGVESYHCLLDVDGNGSPDSLEFWTNLDFLSLLSYTQFSCAVQC
jgi:hypothetical protein